jgi:hypothetical protein
MKAKRIIVMLLVLCLLPVAAFARDEDEQNLMKLSPRTEAKLDAIRNGEWGREDNLLTYLADTYRDNKTLQFVKRNDKLLFGAGTIVGFSLYYIFSQPNKAAQGRAAGKVFRQLKKIF